ncbi:ATP-binding cassette domain-containing protein [Listeria monocytogenes]|nr:ATP-binding cassette domain-containing protein [Listeria monocytogenes]
MENTEKKIVIANVCKQHKKIDVLKNISFEAKSGRITAFLGPNGAGKSSTLRILLGLDRPLSGTATFGSEQYRHFTFPLQLVGSSFDGIAGTPSRSIKSHLKIIAKSNNIPNQRISEVLEIVKLSSKTNSKLGTLSLGEGQRLGIAISLMGNPQFLVLDEPTNGLDPMGIKWFRNFIREQANEGKTVLLSSHYLSEIEAVADDVVIINNGQIIASGELHTVMQNIESLEDVFFMLTEGGI